MQIKTKFYINIVLSIGIMLVVGVILLFASLQIKKTLKTENIAVRIIIEVFELNLLVNDYSLHHGERARIQWQKKHRLIKTLLADAGFDTVKTNILTKIQNEHNRFETIFSKLIQNFREAGKNDKRLRERLLSTRQEELLISQLLLKSQSMISLSRQLKKESEEESLRIQQLTILLVFLVIVIFTGLISLISVLLSRRIVIPVLDLSEGAKNLAEGNLDFRINLKRNDEMGQLSRSFDKMAENLKTNITAKKSLNVFLRSIKNIHQIMVRERSREEMLNGICRTLTSFQDFTSSWITLLDINGRPAISAESGSGKHFDFIQKLLEQGELPDYANQALEKPGIVVVTTSMPADPENPDAGRLSDHSSFSVCLAYQETVYGVLSFTHIRETFLAAEEESLLLGLANDIALVLHNLDVEDEREKAQAEVRNYRDRLEELVKERTRELEASNRELESFAYSISHDLRAPLRAIDGFSRVIQEDYVDKLDKEGRNCLDRIRKGSQRMGDLIDDILKLSRITRGEMQYDTVDLSATVQEITNELRSREPERKVEFVISPDLAAQGDNRLLRIALENLLGNAWKFSSRKESALIEFGVADIGGENAFFVRDNGAGFDMAYVDKLFGAFQRLHGANEFSGTGIGLAIAQRVFHRHGGRIWATGDINKGATFYFVL